MPRSRATSRDRPVRAPRPGALHSRTRSRRRRRRLPSTGDRSPPPAPAAPGRPRAARPSAPRDRAAARSRPSHPRRPSPATGDRTCPRSSGERARGDGPSQAGAAGSRRGSASASPARTVSASRRAPRAPSADPLRAPISSGHARRRAWRRRSPGRQSSTPPIQQSSGDTCRWAPAALRSSPSERRCESYARRCARARRGGSSSSDSARRPD